MKIENTFIKELKVLRPDKIHDARGFFIKTFNEVWFKTNDLVSDFKENYFSVSHKNVIRGMHFQLPPAAHTKLVFLNSGSVIDVVLDLRKNSATFGKHFSINISMDAPAIMYIPVGCAHGFLSLEDNTIVSYLQTSVYDNQFDEGVKWNSFGMNWIINNPIISLRDNAFKDFKNFNSPF
jgi:dTDP-4-dehydrorhamnose 3,5-epimerase/CDP-3, 6-dideoxy-D-glycero-D-glycero-4-hexulose-5-epimerase